MTIESIYNQIAKIEREIAVLPEGSITKKKIRGKDYYYQRITRGGKRIEGYVSFEQVPDLKEKIEKRRALEKKLKELRQTLPKEEQDAGRIGVKEPGFKTKVRSGRQLESRIAITRKYKKRRQRLITAVTILTVLLAIVAVIMICISLRKNAGTDAASASPEHSAVTATGETRIPSEDFTAASGTVDAAGAKSSGAREIILSSVDDEGITTDNIPLVGNWGDLGYHVNVDRTDSSNVIIIGDSRIVAVSAEAGCVSYNATVGAHYLYQQEWADHEPPMIIPYGMEQRDEYYGQMASLVRKCMEMHDSCMIVIVSSVNDLDYWNWCEAETSRMMELGNMLKEEGTSGGNSPELYYMGMVPLEGEFEVKKQGSSTADFNDYLKEKLSVQGDGTYIGISDISAWDGLYTGDGTHFKPEGNRQLFELIISAVKSGKSSKSA